MGKLDDSAHPSTNSLIRVNLHDYDVGKSDYSYDVNRGHDFKFGPKGEGGFNEWTDTDNSVTGGGVYQGIVNSELDSNGYPTLNSNVTHSSQSLDYLFNGEQSTGVVENHSNVDGLFKKDSKGYYTYDSSKNFATLNRGSGNFDLYNQGRFSTEKTLQSQGAFLPFDDLSGGTKTYKDGLAGSVEGYTLNDENKDYTGNFYFGMDAAANFYMPEGGKVNGEDMVFNFEGDDDVWVFLDGKLLLDMGGIHLNYSGSINFANKTVNVSRINNNKKPQVDVTKTFKTILGSDWDSTAYKNHTLKFFYLERGAGASNCKLSFNFPSVPDGSIDLAKRVDGDAPASAADKDYEFKPYVDYDGEDGTGDYELYTGAYQIYNLNGMVPVGDLVASSNGTITLKKDQVARLQPTADQQQIKQNSKYYVTEMAPNHVWTVSASNEGNATNADIPVTQTTNDATTDKLTVSKVPRLYVTNTYPATPVHHKTVEKTNGGDGDQYDLNLDVSAPDSVDTTKPADVVLVVDESSSMNVRACIKYSGSICTGLASKTKMRTVVDAVKTLTGKLLTKENSELPVDKQIQVSVVIFGGRRTGSGCVRVPVQWSKDKATVDASIPTTAPGDNGTNWEAGLHAANQLTNDSRIGAQRYIAFLTDGNPTHYGTGDYPQGSGIETPANVQASYPHAVTEANRREKGTTLYAVTVDPSASRMQQFATATSGVYLDGTDEEKLNEAFSQIADDIKLKNSYQAMSITDTLSKYVEPVNWKADESGDVTQYVSVTGSDGSKPGFTAAYEHESRKLTVTFTGSSGFTMTSGVTYTVNFKVKPSQVAYDEYAKDPNTYPDTGDAGTGSASSDKLGFYSNDSAELTYTVTTGNEPGDPQSVEYPKPVVQVKLGSIDVAKKWKPQAPAGLDKITVKLFQDGGSTALKTLELKPDNWQGAFTGLVPGHSYTVKEVKVSGYSADITYSDRNGQTITSGEGIPLKTSDVWAADADTKRASVAIHNILIAVSSLPLTGGKTNRDWIVIGSVLLLMAMLGAGVAIWRRSRE